MPQPEEVWDSIAWTPTRSMERTIGNYKCTVVKRLCYYASAYQTLTMSIILCTIPLLGAFLNSLFDGLCMDDYTAVTPCELGQVCKTATSDCVVAGVTYTAPTTGACGGELCPAAVRAWELANMQMQMDMMNLNYTGDVDVDFSRSMIPHHLGALGTYVSHFDGSLHLYRCFKS